MIELINMINRESNFDKKEGMLEMFNKIHGTKYGFLGGRVVRFDNPDATGAEKYAGCHDVHADLWYKEEFGGN